MIGTTTFSPQPGRQYEFLSCNADIALYGGAAGGGKTYGLLLDPLRHAVKISRFNAAIFRREATDLKKPGGIWDESSRLYPLVGAKSNNQELNWVFNKTKSRIKFSGMQHETDMKSWQGSQLDYLGFDELTHFTETQFWYLLGRLRSVSGRIKPYCRATCNPENNWVFQLIKWWINEDGSPNLERAGKIRWFYKLDDVIYWFDSEQAAKYDIAQKGNEKLFPSSFTFIPANINDNQILLKNNPNYYAMLSQLPEEEKIKLLDGNWLFRPRGKLFNISYFNHFIVPIIDYECKIVTCDTAAKIDSANDYTVFQCWILKENKIYLEKQIRGKFTYLMQLQLLESFILEMKPNWVSIESASTGISLLQDLPRKVGVPLLATTRDKDKYTRGYQCQFYLLSGYVYVNPKADYFVDFTSEVSQFSPENKNKQHIHDDQVDCMMDAIYYLLMVKIWKNIDKPNEKLNVISRERQAIRFKSVF
ncbi:MAG TPA: phage terminase large subunit [Nitrososphaeraceae archaeon]|nr:phage terminase large subunit [Nitrososphaeraceae archaeon]